MCLCECVCPSLREVRIKKQRSSSVGCISHTWRGHHECIPSTAQSRERVIAMEMAFGRAGPKCVCVLSHRRGGAEDLRLLNRAWVRTAG